MSALIGQTAQSEFSQAAATNHTNKMARAAQDDASHASAASDTSAQLTARAILTIQRRAIDGRSGRPTPSKVDSLIRQAQDQADATGTRLTDDFTLLEQLPSVRAAIASAVGDACDRVARRQVERRHLTTSKFSAVEQNRNNYNYFRQPWHRPSQLRTACSKHT